MSLVLQPKKRASLPFLQPPCQILPYTIQRLEDSTLRVVQDLLFQFIEVPVEQLAHYGFVLLDYTAIFLPLFSFTELSAAALHRPLAHVLRAPI